jgi:hypothetical protein
MAVVAVSFGAYIHGTTVVYPAVAIPSVDVIKRFSPLRHLHSGNRARVFVVVDLCQAVMDKL